MTAHKLRQVAAHGYDVFVAGECIGTVFRTGSLPSCYRWHADGASFRTRTQAVASLLANSPITTNDA